MTNHSASPRASNREAVAATINKFREDLERCEADVVELKLLLKQPTAEHDMGLKFAAVSLADAATACRMLDAEMAAWPSRLEPVRAGPSPDQNKLAEVNLVSGVVDPGASDAAAD
jgi:hypothetical protein